MLFSKARIAPAVAMTVGLALVAGPASAAPDPESGGGYSPGVHVLAHQYQAQQASHWCSAAAARIALTVQGRRDVTQATLAKDLQLPGAHANGPGLQDITLLRNALNRYIPDNRYQLHQYGNGVLPERLATHVRQNIDAKLAVVINVYWIGDTYFKPGHYATIVGYRANVSEFLVADPSNPQRRHVWLSAQTVVRGMKDNRYLA